MPKPTDKAGEGKMTIDEMIGLWCDKDVDLDPKKYQTNKKKEK